MRIIAIGSPFNDDSIAWRCLQALESTLANPGQEPDIHYCNSPGTELIHLLEPNLDTVLVDALLDPGHPGQVSDVDAASLYRAPALSSHDISVANILELAGNLHRRPRNLHILGIAVDEHAALSPAAVSRAQQALLARLRALIPR